MSEKISKLICNGAKEVYSFIKEHKKLGIKLIKSFIDNNIRSKVTPVKGSVLYSDLGVLLEHSGIYIGNDEISNIIVTKLLEGESWVKKSSPKDFTNKAFGYKKIYVSCDKNGAVGDENICEGAKSHIGERNFYGLVFSNCHSFSEKCVNYSKHEYKTGILSDMTDIFDESWEPTIKDLKKTAKKKIGATKWRLWDWKNENGEKNEEEEEKPDINEMMEFFKNIMLNRETIKIIREQLLESKEYMEEISDENLPAEALNMIKLFYNELEIIDKKYESAKEFIEILGQGISYNDLMELKEDFSGIVNEMKTNKEILRIIEKLGRNYISEIKKKSRNVSKMSKNEVFGIHKSDDLIRILPSEMVNFESEELEYLFYAKLLEDNLLTYELGGVSKSKEEYEEEDKKKGPVIACIDTSGSMNGTPILKAKSLLLAMSDILEKENRTLYILLFGDTGQIQEKNINQSYEKIEILNFLNKGYGGGTNFETPIKRGIEIIEDIKEYNKADILMITDGLCGISPQFKNELIKKKEELDFSIYTIICNGNKMEDDFSDEVIGI